MGKLSYLPNQGTARYSSAFNSAVRDSTKVWEGLDFIAVSTLFLKQPSPMADPQQRTILLSEVSSLIFAHIGEFYRNAAGAAIRTAAVNASRPFWDLLRANSHWHARKLDR